MAAQLGRGAGGAPHGAATDQVHADGQPRLIPDGHGAKKATRLSLWFARLAGVTATAMGTPWAFLTAVTIIMLWAVTGPLFGFSDTWQLVINTGTTIVTFLMVFLIQNTQNRDAKAIHLKLDELIRAVKAARNELIDVEEDTDEELQELQDIYREVRQEAPGEGTPPLPTEPPRPEKRAEPKKRARPPRAA